MNTAAVIDHVRHLAGVRANGSAPVERLEEALRTATRLEAWVAGAKAAITSQLAAQVSFPEKTIADCTRGSTRNGLDDIARARTLEWSPSVAAALDDGSVTARHVDEVTRAAKSLDAAREVLFRRLEEGLLDVATQATVVEWRRRLAQEVKNILRDGGVDRLERQKRSTSVRTWTDDEGMWCLSGRFDPVAGVRLAAKLDDAVDALFAEEAPDTCPHDPVDEQRHLRARALARLIEGQTRGGRPGRPEFVVVVDTSSSDGAGGPVVDWGIPVEVPHSVLAQMMGEGSVETVFVRNGVVLHAPGQLDLGRRTRLASDAQRRALRALYATCAIPGCTVRFEQCDIHHVRWWRHGGRTDLDNLLPVCRHHHTKIHDAGWVISLDAHRELTIRFPDGTIRNTGPPTRRAA